MATLALSAVRPLQELAAVLVLVAIRTKIVGNWPLEVAALVTGQTLNCEVFPQQGKVGLRVIEIRGEAGLSPGGRTVAGFATLFEPAFVRIAMAIRTL